MSAVSPMVVLLLLAALVVAVAMVGVATGRFGAGIGLPERPRRPRRRARRASRSQDLR